MAETTKERNSRLSGYTAQILKALPEFRRLLDAIDPSLPTRYYVAANGAQSFLITGTRAQLTAVVHGGMPTRIGDVSVAFQLHELFHVADNKHDQIELVKVLGTF